MKDGFLGGFDSGVSNSNEPPSSGTTPGFPLDIFTVYYFIKGGLFSAQGLEEFGLEIWLILQAKFPRSNLK
jgi:hypothetical protein